MPGFKNCVRKYKIFMTTMAMMLIMLYFLMSVLGIGCMPVPACLKNMKITNKNIPFMIIIHPKLKYQFLLVKNNGTPLPV